MDQGFRRGFTAAEKTELWDRWQRGESLKAIGRAFGKPSSSIYFQVSPYGGIRPAPRRRSRLALTLREREEISRGIAVMATRPARHRTGDASRPLRISPRIDLTIEGKKFRSVHEKWNGHCDRVGVKLQCGSIQFICAMRALRRLLGAGATG